MKTLEKRRRAIEKPASGVDRDGSAEPVVEFGEDGSFHCPGPNPFHNENALERCGAHLFFSAIGMISNFCVHQMLMSYGVHAIDMGIITTLIRANLMN